MEPFVVIATIVAKPHKSEELRDTLVSLIEPTSSEDGCMRYELNEDLEGGRWIFTEQWESREAWERHMEMPYLENFKSKLDELVTVFDLFNGIKIE